MNLILTSFGLSHLERNFRRDSDYQRSSSAFYRMPPIRMSDVNRFFMPDFAILLLCEQLIIDSESFEIISKGKHSSAYEKVSEIIRDLYNEGFIRIEDFGSIVDDNKDLLERMLERDLRRLDEWVKPFEESNQIWATFYESARNLIDAKHTVLINKLSGLIHNEREMVEDTKLMQEGNDFSHYMHELGGSMSHTMHKFELLRDAIKFSAKRRYSKHRDILRETLSEYLAYINSNLVISHKLETGFHDWYDFAPFYREKFLDIGHDDGRPEEKKIQKVKQLFEVSFPEFDLWDRKKIVKALKDKRIVDLRYLIEKATKEEIVFDREFANKVLLEVVGIERRIGRLRNIVSYASLPIGLLPWVGTPAQKGVEEVAGRIIDKKARKPYRWFYLISELGGKAE